MYVYINSVAELAVLQAVIVSSNDVFISSIQAIPTCNVILLLSIQPYNSFLHVPVCYILPVSTGRIWQIGLLFLVLELFGPSYSFIIFRRPKTNTMTHAVTPAPKTCSLQFFRSEIRHFQ